MTEHRVLTERIPFEVVDGEQVYKQLIEWRDDQGRVLRRGSRFVTEDNRLFRTITLKYDEVPA